MDSTCYLVVSLMEATGNQLTCFNFVDVNGTKFNIICVKCPSLLCLRLCFYSDQNLQSHRQYREAKPDNIHAPNVEYVRFRKLFLPKYHTVNYILKFFRNFRRLFMGHTSYEGNFLEEILRRKHLIRFEEVFCGNQGVVTFSARLFSATRFYADGKISHPVHDLHTCKVGFVNEKCKFYLHCFH